MRQFSRKHRLTIDIGPLLEDQWTGIPVFTQRLIRALEMRGDVDLEFAVNLVRYPNELVKAAMVVGTGSFLRNDFESRGPDSYGTVDPTIPIFYPSTKGKAGRHGREASTVHDMSTLFMPENHTALNVAHHLDHFENELATNDAIFCISQSTRAALLSAVPSVANKTRLLYQYAHWSENFELMESNMPRLNLGRYAVVIGTLEPRKNLALLLEALPLPAVVRQALTFLVIGKKGWNIDSFLENLTASQRKSLIFSGFVSEFTKYRLIKGAEFLIFPSIYEGFGIPALEAMSLGKPVLAARSSSLPEVIEDAGVYFDPLSPTEFADALTEIANPKRLAELSPKAIKQNAAFGPARMAEPVVEWVSQ